MIPIILAQSILFFIVGGIIDSSIFSVNMVFAILISLVTSLFFIAIGILLGSRCNEKSVGGISSIVIAGQSVLSGMWFPIEGLSEGMITFMNVLPFRNATLLVQNVVSGINDVCNDFLIPLIIVLAYAIVSFILAIVAFKIKMKSN